jgi:hypothetical protein
MKAKKTPNKKMPVAKKAASSYAPKGPKAKAKATGKKKMPKAKKSSIQDKLAKVKF